MFFNFKSISGDGSGEALWKATATQFIEKLNYSFDFNSPWNTDKIIIFLNSIKFHLEKNENIKMECDSESIFFENALRISAEARKILNGPNYVEPKITGHIENQKFFLEKSLFQRIKTFRKEIEDTAINRPQDVFITLFKIHKNLNLRAVFPDALNFEENSLVDEEQDAILMVESINYKFQFFYQERKFLTITFTEPNIQTTLSGKTFIDFNLDDKENLIIP